MNRNLTEPLPQSLDSRRSIIVLCSLLMLAAVQFFIGLGGLPLLGPDEPRYAEVAREMFASGNYVSPFLCGHLWFEKPALLYWLQAAAYHVFGVSEFAARFPSALAALATLLFVYFALRRAVSWRMGLLAALVLATSVAWWGFARGATTDMVLAATISVAVLSGYLATLATETVSTATLAAETVAVERQRRTFLLLCAASTGLAMLAKGLVGIVFVVLILGIYAVVTRRRLIQRPGEALGMAAVFLLVMALWYVPVTLAHGQEFIDEFFINHHFKRYLTNDYNHPQPVYYYLFVSAVGAMPWTFFLLPAISRLRTLQPRRNEHDALLALAWIWVAVPLLFFSFSTSKLPGYILPIFPALAVVLGFEAERIWNSERTWDGERTNGTRTGLEQALIFLTFALLLTLGVGAGIYLHRKGGVLDSGTVTALLGLLCTGGLIAATWTIVGKARAAVISPVAIMPCIILVAVTVLFPRVYQSLSLKPLSLQIAAALKPQEEIILFHTDRQYAPVFYNEGRVKFYKGSRILHGMARGDELDVEIAAQLIEALKYEQSEGKSSVILITSPGRRNDLQRDPRFQTEMVGQYGRIAALRVSLNSATG
ncbi:MAG TPA: glycosyltransferase family 39 protein [Abditibacteriaceae bacterium]|jgi:4-amino-4-deoxy-L-arabinose transferase-like glycosyltransferase